MSEEILKDKKLALYGKKDEDSKGAPKLQPDIYKGMPSLSVFTNAKDDDGKPIRVGMDIVIWSSLRAAIMDLINAEPSTVYQIINRRGLPQKLFTDSQTFVGRDKNGVLYIAVKKEGKKTIPFYFLPGMYWGMADGQGNPLDDAKTSEMVAVGWVNALHDQIQRAAAQTYEAPQQQGGGQRGGGGYSGGGGRSGGGSTDFDDDLPM